MLRRDVAAKKVLIIEDYYALADIEHLLCTMEGYEVRVAKNGVADAESDLARLEVAPRAEKTTISDALHNAFQKLRDARAPREA